MSTRHFATLADAHTYLNNLFDVAPSGRVATVGRGLERFAVVDAEVLRKHLTVLRPSGAVVVAEGSGWAAFLPGVPISGEGTGRDEAICDLIDALREYTADWFDRLFDTPNHQDNWALVTLIDLSTDEQIKMWILGTETPVT